MIDAYPLSWPAHWPRSQYHERALFKTPFGRARDQLLNELRLLGASDVVISSNYMLRRDGLPYADSREPEDKGVAVYFKLNGEDQCVPCDRWTSVVDNLQAIRLTVEAIRGLDRWGAKEMVNAAFRGFKALPAAGNSTTVMDEPWYEILGVASDATEQSIRSAFKQKAKLYHPDTGGDEAEFARIRKAFERGMHEAKRY